MLGLKRGKVKDCFTFECVQWEERSEMWWWCVDRIEGFKFGLVSLRTNDIGQIQGLAERVVDEGDQTGEQYSEMSLANDKYR